MPDLTVVVPVHRNASTLRELHARLAAALRPGRIDYEIVFVDDACPEGSFEVLRALALEDPRVAAIALAANVGQNRAILAGLAEARGAAVVAMDADLQDPPEAVPALLKRLAQGDAAAVFAGRRGRYQSGARMATSLAFKRALHVVSAGGVPKDAGLFVAMRRDLVERLLAARVRDPHVVALIGRTGLPTTSIPVERAARRDGRTAYSTAARARAGGRGLRTALWPEGGPPPQAPVRERVGARYADGVAARRLAP